MKLTDVLAKWCRAFIEICEFSEFRESDKSLKHELDSILRLVSHMGLAGAVVASWSLTSYIRGGRFESFYCNDKYFCH